MVRWDCWGAIHQRSAILNGLWHHESGCLRKPSCSSRRLSGIKRRDRCFHHIALQQAQWYRDQHIGRVGTLCRTTGRAGHREAWRNQPFPAARAAHKATWRQLHRKKPAQDRRAAIHFSRAASRKIAGCLWPLVASANWCLSLWRWSCTRTVSARIGITDHTERWCLDCRPQFLYARIHLWYHGPRCVLCYPRTQTVSFTIDWQREIHRQNRNR